MQYTDGRKYDTNHMIGSGMEHAQRSLRFLNSNTCSDVGVQNGTTQRTSLQRDVRQRSCRGTFIPMDVKQDRVVRERTLGS